VALFRFSGALSRGDIGAVDHACKAFLAAEGGAHFVFDFTAVETVAVPDEAIARRGKRPQLNAGYQRVVVAPQVEISELFRLFAANQVQIGAEPPTVVKTLRQALIHLGVGRPAFRAVAVEDRVVRLVKKQPRGQIVSRQAT
jgi:hypothetical protein